MAILLSAGGRETGHTLRPYMSPCSGCTKRSPYKRKTVSSSCSKKPRTCISSHRSVSQIDIWGPSKWGANLGRRRCFYSIENATHHSCQCVRVLDRATGSLLVRFQAFVNGIDRQAARNDPLSPSVLTTAMRYLSVVRAKFIARTKIAPRTRDIKEGERGMGGRDLKLANGYSPPYAEVAGRYANCAPFVLPVTLG